MLSEFVSPGSHTAETCTTLGSPLLGLEAESVHMHHSL